MSKLQLPENDWAKALYILQLHYMEGVNMAKVLTHHDPTFYKFQTRVSDILRAHPKLKISKVPIPFKKKLSKTQQTGYYYQYTLLSPKPYVTNLYNLLNREGLKKTPKTK